MNDKDSDSQFFRPEEVDQQIDRLVQIDASKQKDAEFIHYLRNLYIPAPQEEQQRLDTVWERIEQQIPRVQQKQQQNRMPVFMIEENTLTTPPSSQRRKRPFFFRMGNLVAAVLLACILGASIFFFVQVHYQSMSTPHGNATPTSRSTPIVAPSKQIGTIVYTSSGAITLHWSPDGQRLVTGTTQAESWDATTGKNVVTYGTKEISGVGGVAWSPDGRQIAVTNISQPSVKLYNAATGQLESEYNQDPLALGNTPQFAPLVLSSPFLPTSSGGPGAFLTAWSPDGKRMVTSFRNISAGAHSIQIWDVFTKKMLLNYPGHNNLLDALSWSPDGQYILSSDTNGSTQVWDSQTGQRILDLESHQAWPNAAWSPDGHIIAYSRGDDTVELIDAKTGQVLLTHYPQIANSSSMVPSNVVWSPDGRSIASGTTQIELWDTTTGKTYATFTDQGFFILNLTWSPTGAYLASCDSGIKFGKVRVWIAQ